jgi:hypothetical protein
MHNEREKNLKIKKREEDKDRKMVGRHDETQIASRRRFSK